MRTNLSITFVFWCICEVLAQSTFIKTYDFFDGVNESARNMFIEDDVVFILGSGGCDEGSCLHFYKLNIDGDVLLTNRYPSIVPATRCWLRDSSIYVAGRQRIDSLESRADGYRLFELSLDGEIKNTAIFNQNSLYSPPGYPILSYWPRGTIANDSKIVVYGDTSEDDGINDRYRRGLLMYYNKDLSFDTLVFINPKYRHMEMWNADLNQDEHFNFLFDYNEWIQEEEIDYRTIIRYDNFAEQLWRWDPPELYTDTELFITFDILSSGKIAIELENNKIYDSNDLLLLDNSGQTQWRTHQKFATVDIGILDITETSDNNLLLAGFSDSPHQGSHIRKVNSSTGEDMWDRAFRDFDDEATGNAVTGFFNVHELPDRTILLAGTRRDRKFIDSTVYITHDDLQLIRLDAEGCLEPGCGGLEQVTGGVAPYTPLPYFTHEWHYQKYDTELGLFKQAYTSVPTLGEIYKEDRAEEILDVELGGWPNRSTKLLRLEDEGRKIYYIEDYDVSQEDVLLYDFTLEVGDLFVSDYIDHPLEVIESDTLRLTDRSKMRYWVLACSENPGQTITWLENIGTYNGVAWPRDFCSGDYGDETMTCFYRHNRLVHMNPDVSDCLMPSSTDDKAFLELSAISLAPNPTHDFVTITGPHGLNIERTELLDTQGRTHTAYYDHSSEVRIDLRSYPSGLYFLSINTEEGSVVKKVVVAH